MNKRGVTLVELLIVAAIGAIVIAMIVFGVSRCTSQSGSAEDGARAWAASMGITPKGVNCVDRDTDGDGYVSCTVSEETKDGTKMHSIECASKWAWNEGCRVPKMGPRVR